MSKAYTWLEKAINYNLDVTDTNNEFIINVNGTEYSTTLSVGVFHTDYARSHNKIIDDINDFLQSQGLNVKCKTGGVYSDSRHFAIVFEHGYNDIVDVYGTVTSLVGSPKNVFLVSETLDYNSYSFDILANSGDSEIRVEDDNSVYVYTDNGDGTYSVTHTVDGVETSLSNVSVVNGKITHNATGKQPFGEYSNIITKKDSVGTEIKSYNVVAKTKPMHDLASIESVHADKSSLSISNDGSVVVFGGLNSNLVSDTTAQDFTNNSTKKLSKSSSHQDILQKVSQDGTRVAYWDKTTYYLYVVDIPTNSIITSFKVYYTNFAISNNFKYLYYKDTYNDGGFATGGSHTKIIDLDTLTIIYDDVTSSRVPRAISNDGDRLMYADSYTYVHEISTDTRIQIHISPWNLFVPNSTLTHCAHMSEGVMNLITIDWVNGLSSDNNVIGAEVTPQYNEIYLSEDANNVVYATYSSEQGYTEIYFMNILEKNPKFITSQFNLEFDVSDDMNYLAVIDSMSRKVYRMYIGHITK